MSQRLVWKCIIGAIGFALLLPIIGRIIDQTRLDPRIQVDPILKSAVQDQIRGNQSRMWGRYCWSANLWRIDELRKIAPHCDFLRLSWARPSVRSPFHADSLPSHYFQVIAVRRSDGMSTTVLDDGYSPDWFPKFLMWAQIKLRNPEDAQDITNAMQRVFRASSSAVPDFELLRPKLIKGNLWITDDTLRGFRPIPCELEVADDGTIVRYRVDPDGITSTRPRGISPRTLEGTTPIEAR